MSAEFKAPRGTFDSLPGDQPARQRIEDTVRRILEAAGYQRIETPAFEDTDLFTRGVGQSTDIVQKQMFSFTDQGDRALTLRPEGTAPVCRAYIEHGMHKLPQPVKLWYSGPFFRHERPQSGRYRQFHQLGAEAIGSDEPLVDAELIVLLNDLIAELGVEGVRLRLGSLGSPGTRQTYVEQLRDYLRSHEAELAKEVVARLDVNPLRAFDSDHEGTRKVMAEAPKLLDNLDPEDRAHFEEVRGLLDRQGVAYEIDSTLVRGLDYYTRTVFEFESEKLGAQSGLGGGGRYDGLVEQLGGPPTPAAGWAAGIERIALALEAEPEPRAGDAFIVAGDAARKRALALATELRRAGFSVDLDLAGRAAKGQMKQADRAGARYAVFLEDDGSLQLRDMASGEQRAVEESQLASEIGASRD
ncbi:MAG: histidine--tRNA ligase [Solirubrobacterales bacterium]